jgi:putative aldouronate transport system permease protein
MLARTKIKDLSSNIMIYFILIVALFVTLYPFYYIVIMSFNDGLDSAKGGVYLFPRKFSIENYKKFFSDDKWIRGFFVSVTRTILGAVLTVIFTSLVAYGLSFRELVLKKVYFVIIIFSMYFSGGIIPYYVLLRWLGLINHFSVYIIPEILSPFFILVTIAFFREMPGELHESARIDGANDLTIFLRIIMPLSMPIVATIALFSGVSHWNSWLDSAFFIQNPALRTLSYLMMVVINQSQINANASYAELAHFTTSVTIFSIQMTAVVIAVVPIIFVYPFLQRYFIKGLMIGSVKG